MELAFDKHPISSMDENTKIHANDNTDMANSVHFSPKTRPRPTFFSENATFSTKKQKETPKLIDIYPPKPPIKSCPPMSRLKPQRKPDHDGARVITFLNKDAQNDSGTRSCII